MEKRKLGKTDLEVTALCLGTMTWGEQNSEAQAHEQLDYALEQGINFIDTAEMYPVPANEETHTRTETYIGNWLKSRGIRDRVVVATKITGPQPRWTWVRGAGGKHCLNRANIEAAIEGSLRRLQTDHVDLYQLHWPDRVTNYFGTLNYPYTDRSPGTPIEETVAALADLIQAGKIRHYGLSNETPWGVSEFLRVAREQDLPAPVSIQNPFSLLNRSFEIGLSEFSHREKVGLLAYSPLSFGVLTGKYQNDNWPEGARLTLFGKYFKRYTNDQCIAATERYVALAKEHGLSPTAMALAFVTTRRFTTSTIIGATTMDQLKENIASHSVTLDKSVIKAIDAIHADIPNPAP